MRAIILSRQDYREADQLITLFSYERGKETCFVKSVKKITSKNSPFLEPGVIAEIDTVPAHEFVRLIRAVPLVMGAAWRADLFRAQVGTILLRILENMVPSATPEKSVFDSFAAWLDFLNASSDTESVLSGATACVLSLVSTLGFQPILDRCVDGHEILGDAEVAFDPSQGGYVCALHAVSLSAQAVRLASFEARQLADLAVSSWSRVGSMRLATIVHLAVWSLASRAFDRPLPRWWVVEKNKSAIV